MQHQFGCAHLAIGFGDWKLNALVLSDGAAKNLPLASIARSFFNEPFGISDAFGCDQNTFGIHSGENISKAFAFFADKIALRNAEIIKK